MYRTWNLDQNILEVVTYLRLEFSWLLWSNILQKLEIVNRAYRKQIRHVSLNVSWLTQKSCISELISLSLEENSPTYV